jgi:hypothetical protein
MWSRRPPTIIRALLIGVAGALNTMDAGVNPYKTAASVALLGIKPGTAN